MAVSPLNTLMQDPAFAMFISASGMQEELALADAARRRHAINQSLGIQEEQIADQGQQQRKGIAGEHAMRGAPSSGQHLEENAQSEKNQARASALAQLNAADQLGEVESGLMTGNVNRQFDIGSNALDALTRQLTAQGEDSIDNEVTALGQAGTNPLTGIPSVSPMGAEPAAVPIGGVGISTKKRQPLLGGYKRDF
jgi:hypothetical protein